MATKPPVKRIEDIVTEVGGLFLSKKIRVVLINGKKAKRTLKHAYKKNLLVQCNFPNDKYIHAQQAHITKCGNIYRNQADFEHVCW